MSKSLATYDLTSNGPLPDAPFVAIAPGTAVVCHQIDLPKKVTAAAKAAIARRQLEDRLSSEGAEFHPVQTPTKDQLWNRAVAVDATTAAAWRARLAPSGTRCKALIPDYFTLPVSKDSGTLWIVASPDAEDSPEIIARLSPEYGFRAEWALGLAALRLADALPASLEVFGTLDADHHAQLVALGPDIIFRDSDTPSLDQVAMPRSGFAVDLLQDEAFHLRKMQTTLRRWSIPVVLLLIAALVWSAGLWSQQRRDAQLLAGYTATSTALVRQYFIPEGPLLDLRAQVQQVVGTSNAGSTDQTRIVDPMPHIRAASEVLDTMADQVDQLVYTAPAPDQPLALSVASRLADFAQVDTLVAALQAAGMIAIVTQSAADTAGGVRATLRIAAP